MVWDWYDDIVKLADWSALQVLFHRYFTTHGRSIKHLHERWKDYILDSSTNDILVFISDIKQMTHEFNHKDIAVLNLIKGLYANRHLWYLICSLIARCGLCYGKGYLCQEAWTLSSHREHYHFLCIMLWNLKLKYWRCQFWSCDKWKLIFLIMQWKDRVKLCSKLVIIWRKLISLTNVHINLMLLVSEGDVARKTL